MVGHPTWDPEVEPAYLKNVYALVPLDPIEVYLFQLSTEKKEILLAWTVKLLRRHLGTTTRSCLNCFSRTAWCPVQSEYPSCQLRLHGQGARVGRFSPDRFLSLKTELLSKAAFLDPEVFLSATLLLFFWTIPLDSCYFNSDLSKGIIRRQILHEALEKIQLEEATNETDWLSS